MPQVQITAPLLADVTRVLTKKSLAYILGGFTPNITGRYVRGVDLIIDILTHKGSPDAQPVRRSFPASTASASTFALTWSIIPVYLRALANMGTCSSASGRTAVYSRRANTAMSLLVRANSSRTTATTTSYVWSPSHGTNGLRFPSKYVPSAPGVGVRG